MKFVADHIRAHRRAEQRKEYALFFVPRRTMIAERHLEEEGVYEEVTIGEYRLDLIPFDHDLLSLELEESFKECYLVRFSLGDLLSPPFFFLDFFPYYF